MDNVLLLRVIAGIVGIVLAVVIIKRRSSRAN
jgi:hypothetical protein